MATGIPYACLLELELQEGLRAHPELLWVSGGPGGF